MDRPAAKAMTRTSTTGTLKNNRSGKEGFWLPLLLQNGLSRLHDHRGFTLLELIIVCLLITISLAVSVPSLRQALVVDELAASSRKIIAMIREARTVAANTQQPQLLYIDIDKGRIWFTPDTPSARLDQKNNQTVKKEEWETKPEPDTKTAVIRLSQPVHIQDVQSGSPEKATSGTIPLWISPQGYMEQSSLHLRNDNDTITLTISPFQDTIKAYDSYITLE